jgi:hypothetical protein
VLALGLIAVALCILIAFGLLKLLWSAVVGLTSFFFDIGYSLAESMFGDGG